MASVLLWGIRVASDDGAQPPSSPSVPTTAETRDAMASSEPIRAGSDLDSCDFRDEIDRVRNATVRIVVEFASGQLATGTGFHLGEGRYVSAAHVVQDDSGQQAANVRIESAASGQDYAASIESVGDISSAGWGRDIAILRAEAIPSSLEWRAPTASDIDRDVRVLGYPWSQESDGGSIPPPLVVRGTLASMATVDGVDVVQSSARAEEGMSGGPLVDECGTALAVTSGARLRVNEIGALREGFGVFVSMSEFQRLP